MKSYQEYLHYKGYSEKSVESFTKTIHRYLQYLESKTIQATEVDYNVLLDYIKSLRQKGNSQRTQQQTMNVIGKYYEYLQKTEQIIENPATAIQIKGDKRKTLHSILKVEELELIEILYREKVKDNMTKKRNEVMLSLLIHQGLRTAEITRLELSDLKLREGKIEIRGSRRTERRTMKLKSSQLYMLMEYLQTTRKELLEMSGKETEQVFITTGKSYNLQNTFQKLLKTLKKYYPKLENLKQIRATVISQWLKTYNIRKVQYMAGHRYVSSTEAYRGNDIESLQNDISKYHPL